MEFVVSACLNQQDPCYESTGRRLLSAFHIRQSLGISIRESIDGIT